MTSTLKQNFAIGMLLLFGLALSSCDPARASTMPVCGSTAPVETEDYVWIRLCEVQESEIYTLVKSTEYVDCFRYNKALNIDIQPICDGWTKYYKRERTDIEWGGCVEWNWQKDKPLMEGSGPHGFISFYSNAPTDCLKQIGFRRDGTVLWRKPK